MELYKAHAQQKSTGSELMSIIVSELNCVIFASYHNVSLRLLRFRGSFEGCLSGPGENGRSHQHPFIMYRHSVPILHPGLVTNESTFVRYLIRKHATIISIWQWHPLRRKLRTHVLCSYVTLEECLSLAVREPLAAANY